MDKNFKRILVGFDNSLSAQIALEKAVDMSERFSSKIYAIYVSKDREDLDQVQAAVKKIGDRRNADIDFIEKQGKVYKEINILERELGIDVIIVGTHGNEGWQPFWIGSNAYRVVSASNCPVITIQETTKMDVLQDILLPLDDSDETRQKVPYCALMAQAFDATVHIYGVSGGKSNDTANRISAYISQVEDFMHERGIRTRSNTELGVNIPKAVQEEATRTRAGLIMMMTETESTSFIMGSYAQQIINNSQVPVMSIHSRDLYVGAAVGY
jgi:nucleotide-binding universal stress UspA family protein